MNGLVYNQEPGIMLILNFLFLSNTDITVYNMLCTELYWDDVAIRMQGVLNRWLIIGSSYTCKQT